MNLVFKKMHIDNFMSFDKEVFDFQESNGICLITGVNNDVPGSKNGCGKSSLINAFVFALFGRMLNQMNLKNVSNRYVDARPTSVILEMEVDGIPYTIISGIKTSPITGTCSLYRATLENISKENALTKHSTRETRAFIEKNIIQTSFDVFLRSFVLTSDQFYNFFKMSKQDKRIFIENIFDLQVFGEMYRTIHKDKLENDKVLSSLDTLVASQENDIKDISEKYKHAETSKQSEIDELNSTMSVLKKLIKERQEKLSKFDRKKLNDTLDKLNKMANDIRNKKSKLSSSIKSKNQLVEHMRRQYEEKIEYVKTYIDTYNQLSEHSKPIVNEKLGLETVKSSAKKIAESVNSELAEIRSMMEELNKCEVPENVINTIEKIKKAISNIDRLEIQIKNDIREIKRCEESINKLETNPSVLKELLEKKQTDHSERSKELNEVINTRNILTFIESVVGEENIRRLVVADLIKLLNNQIQTYLSSMGADFTCMFDKDLNYTFLTKNGETEYSAFSSGEKMRLSIATSFAFRDFIVNRSGINSNVLILDEYIDANLDDLAVKEIFKILREFNILYNQNIFVVSHREAVKLNTFDGVYSVDKTEGISKIIKQVGE